MKSKEIRDKFLKFFAHKGHKILPGSSLIPADPSVLLTLAGMLQFKPIFLGERKPSFRRVATVQKCIRMVDIEKVGITPRHHTFFEMLGNFSFGDYFKKEVIEFAWELLTQEFRLSKEKLLVAVYEKDDEAYEIWNKIIGLSTKKIFRLGEENNFWAVGPTGPCGPCSEIYYDGGQEKSCNKENCQPGCDCDRYLELWNLVFIQFNRQENGELKPLRNLGIDTGMGLERLAGVLQKGESNFETDLFLPLIQRIKSLTTFKKGRENSIRIIADHLRGIVHLIADGILPENVGRGYVLRRLIRRSTYHGKLLGIKLPFLARLSLEVINLMSDAYQELKEKESLIKKVVDNEEENFLKTLDQGLEIFKELIEKYKESREIPGEEAFKLHDTYGFPLDLTKELAQQNGLKIEEEAFAREMERQKERGRTAGIAEAKKELSSLDLKGIPPTEFVGYEKDFIETKVIALFSKEKLVVLEKTPFYAEGGGQISDTGILSLGEQEIHVLNCFLHPSCVILHQVEELKGLKEGIKVFAQIDAARRKAIALHHTTTHLLHKALREILGSEIKQAGSYVGPEALRFDFICFSPPSPQKLDQIEELVNKKIKEKIKVETLEKSYSDALKMGATALFGEKYGKKTRVLKIGNFSLELCGGTHSQNTQDLLFFKIIKESALGAGVRRLEAVAGTAAKIYVLHQAKSLQNEIRALMHKLQLLEKEKEEWGGRRQKEIEIFAVGSSELETLQKAVDYIEPSAVKKILDHLQGRIEWLEERIYKGEKEIEERQRISMAQEAEIISSEAESINHLSFLFKEFEDYSMSMLRSLADDLKSLLKSCLFILVSQSKSKIIYLITLTSDLLPLGYSAQDFALKFSSIMGGKCGGNKEKAEGGGGDPTKIQSAFTAMASILRNQVQEK